MKTRRRLLIDALAATGCLAAAGLWVAGNSRKGTGAEPPRPSILGDAPPAASECNGAKGPRCSKGGPPPPGEPCDEASPGAIGRR